MCRSIKVLRRPGEAPATKDELDAAALQFVRKISGFHKPSQANLQAFERAVAEISDAGGRLLSTIEQSKGSPKGRNAASTSERATNAV